MNKIEKTVIGLALVLSVISLVVRFPGKQVVGNIFVEENAYSSAVTYSSTTLTNDVVTSLIPRATSSRNIARVCVAENSANNVATKIFKQATSTGITIELGYPIYGSSTDASQICMTVNANDPYTGQIWGISDATTTVTTEYSQE